MPYITTNVNTLRRHRITLSRDINPTPAIPTERLVCEGVTQPTSAKTNVTSPGCCAVRCASVHKMRSDHVWWYVLRHESTSISMVIVVCVLYTNNNSFHHTFIQYNNICIVYGFLKLYKMHLSHYLLFEAHQSC